MLVSAGSGRISVDLLRAGLRVNLSWAEGSFGAANSGWVCGWFSVHEGDQSHTKDMGHKDQGHQMLKKKKKDL